MEIITGCTDEDLKIGTPTHVNYLVLILENNVSLMGKSGEMFTVITIIPGYYFPMYVSPAKILGFSNSDILW